MVEENFAGIRVDRPTNLETTAFGAGLFAGLGIGLYSDLNDLRSVRRTARIFEPATTTAEKAAIRAQRDGWLRAVQAVRVFAGTA